MSVGAAACVVSRGAAAYGLVATHAITMGAVVDDVDWVVPQNTDVRAWQVLARLLRMDPAKVQTPSLADVAHVISGDNIVNLAALHGQGVVQPGQRLLLTMAGYGMNW